MSGLFEEMEECSDWRIAAYALRPLFSSFSLFSVFYFIGYRQHKYNLLCYFISWYYLFHFIAGVCQPLGECIVNDDILSILLLNFDSLFSTMATAQWGAFCLIMLYQNPKYQGSNMVKLVSKVWKRLMIVCIIVTELSLILFVYIWDYYTIFFIINACTRAPFVLGVTMSIVIFIKVSKDDNIDQLYKRKYHIWCILFTCGPVTWILGSIAVAFPSYFLGHFMVTQFFLFNLFWINYLESLKQFQFYDNVNDKVPFFANTVLCQSTQEISTKQTETKSVDAHAEIYVD